MLTAVIPKAEAHREYFGHCSGQAGMTGLQQHDMGTNAKNRSSDKSEQQIILKGSL
jgi:hypothetical protein